MEENKQEELQDDQRDENATWRNRARMAIYPMAGIYVIYQAYNTFREISVTSGNEQMLMIIFTILFAVLGLALIVFGLVGGYRNSVKMRQKKQQEEIKDSKIEK